MEHGNAKPKDAFENGATRSELKLRYDLLPRSAVDALVRRLTLGATIHGENNWKGGGLEFYRATKNHLFAHVLAFMETGSQEDLDAILCNAAFLTEYKRTGQDRAAIPTGATPCS